MRPPAELRQVLCYLCAQTLEVSSLALSVTCSGCNRNITIEDLILNRNRPKLLMVSRVQTCGRIVVPKRTRLVAELIDAHGGIEVHGHLEAKKVRSRGHVTVAKKAFWRGDLIAPAITVSDHAVIELSFFKISPRVLLPQELRVPRTPPPLA